MIKKASIFTLNAYTAQGAADTLRLRMQERCGELEQTDFANPAELIGVALSCKGMAVAAAPISQYLDVKLQLIKKLGLRPVRSKSISEALGATGITDKRTLDLHSAVPEGAHSLASVDGRYSGFLCKTENGFLLLLPLDADIIERFFRIQAKSIFGEAKEKKQSGIARFKQSVEHTVAAGRSIAVAQVGAWKPLMASIMTVENADKIFLPVELAKVRKKDTKIEESYPVYAKEAQKTVESVFGAVVSEILTDEDGSRYVTVCVSDEHNARCVRVFEENPEEQEKHLLSAAIIKLCSMLDEIPAEGLVPPAETEIRAAKNPTKPFLFAIAGVLAAILLCVILTVAFGANSEKALFADATTGTTFFRFEETQSQTLYDYHGEVGIGDFDLETTQDETTTLLPETTQTTTQRITKKITTTAKTIKTTLASIVTTTKAAIKTTAKPTTTTKPTEKATEKTTEKTTAEKTTEKEKETTTATQKASTSGEFVFKVYGYGHGVGMSQEGAVQMAKDGSTYKQILAHYYPDTKLKTDSNTPKKVEYGGKEIPIVKYLCGTAKQEIGESAPAEALKAQLVCAYTFAKTYNFNVPSSQHAYDDSFDYEGTALHKACLEVLNMEKDSDTPKAVYVDYNGSAARTVYFASAGGKTTSAKATWGATQYPYLSGGAACMEKVDATTVTITSEDMKKYILAYDKNIKLGDDPSEWLEIISHDSARDENCGYVEKIRVGDKTISGNKFRANVLSYKIRSHCFTFEYIPE